MKTPATDLPHTQEHRILWAGLFLLTALFVKAPFIDVMVSSQFYTPELGFQRGSEALVQALYQWTPLIGRACLAMLVFFAAISPLIARFFKSRNQPALASKCLGSWRKFAMVAVFTGILGPGLVIEGWLKNTVGRPRPVQITQFGGDQTFVPPFHQGVDPEHHRSFVSSHAATGFWLVSFGLTCGPVWRRRWLLIGLFTGAMIGWGRMMQGGHFLSDIIFSFYAVWLSGQVVDLVAQRRIWASIAD